MRKQYIKIITGIALIALLSIQGVWLYNTYILLHVQLITDLQEGFARSIEKEIYLRLEIHTKEKRSGDIVRGTKPDNDFYDNALAFHEYLLTYNIPLSLEKLDSIWAQKLIDSYGAVKYLLLKTDSVGKTVEMLDRGANVKSRYSFIIERPIRNDHSEHLRVVIESPHKIVLDRMMLLLTVSLLIAVILGYSLLLQIWMIIRLERISAIRQDFTHSMVHDLKNPVTNILFSTGTLKSGKLDDKIEMKEKYFNIVIKEGNRLLSFCNKILTIAKFEEYKIELAKSEIDLKEIFTGLIEEYLLFPLKETHFTTDLADDSTIFADPDFFVDVLRNLIDNAIKYSKETVAMHIKTSKHKNDTVIQIRDNGVGIARKDQKHIFKKFERILLRDKEKKSGFGLGLYFVYQVVKTHGGTVGVESVPGEFSEFTITIPHKK